MSALSKIATEHRLFLVEDCAEGFGREFAGHSVGTFGDISTFSCEPWPRGPFRRVLPSWAIQPHLSRDDRS